MQIYAFQTYHQLALANIYQYAIFDQYCDSGVCIMVRAFSYRYEKREETLLIVFIAFVNKLL